MDETKKVLISDTFANFFGIQSKGLRQIRGNGKLVLDQEFLYFRMLLPKRVIRIPVNAIIKAEESLSHLKKTKAAPLLKVTFQNDEGSIDSAAWLVRDLSSWKIEIQSLIDKKGSDTEK
ncbi:hypothetical protein JXA84_04115 [candidate division WOR-3 bacterium]|nr:hypothetical protein [candidate division WOR-3 bacterium]